MKKLIVILSIVIACTVVLTSFNPVVGFFSSNNSVVKGSPLFSVRTQRVQNLQTSSLTPQYIGKDLPIDILLPTRNVIQEDTLRELSKIDVQNKIGNIDQEILNKWQLVLMLAENNLQEINKIIREENVELMDLIEKYQKLTEDELKQEFLTNLNNINLQNEIIVKASSTKTNNAGNANITSGILCNLTSGPICKLTSQPICQLTSQPICDFITILPPCLTLMGLRCPSAGFKCNLPTSGTICKILTKLGPILKTIAIILIIAIIIFIPVIVLVSILNTETCTNIRDQITYLFNCTGS